MSPLHQKDARSKRLVSGRVSHRSRDLRHATCIFITLEGYEWLSTGLPVQNEVRVMLNPYDNDSGCIPPSFITTLSLTPLASHVL